MLQPFNDFFSQLISLLCSRRCSWLFVLVLTSNYPFQGLITTFPFCPLIPFPILPPVLFPPLSFSCIYKIYLLLISPLFTSFPHSQNNLFRLLGSRIDMLFLCHIMNSFAPYVSLRVWRKKWLPSRPHFTLYNECSWQSVTKYITHIIN
jgi:hypothetical protein